MGGRTSRKGRILGAASRIVAREGAAHLTIDAVAAESGLSKGGVLYHFPSKRAMLEGMLASALQDIGARAASHRERLGSGPGAALQAWVLALGDLGEAERGRFIALLAGSAEDPELLEPARAFLRDTFDAVRDGAADPDLNLVLVLAVEGLRLLEALDLLPLEPDEKQRLHGRVLQLAGGGRP